MRTDKLDHEPLVRAWLHEPIWLPPSDVSRIAQLVHQTPQQRGWLPRLTQGRLDTMFSTMKFLVAGVIIATFSGVLVASGLLAPNDPPQLPGAETPSLVAATPGATAAPTLASEPSDPPSVGDLPEDTLVMEPVSGETIGGFSQVGQERPNGRTRYGQLDDLQALDDRLVVRTTLHAPRRSRGDRILYSDDAMTWRLASVPGDGLTITHLVRAGEGLMASGSTTVDGERRAALWTSSDGISWSEAPAPGVNRVDQIVSADPIVVRAGQRLYRSDDGSRFESMGRLMPGGIEHGPGGYLQWQGGGQDLTLPGGLLFMPDDFSGLRELAPPGEIGRTNDVYAGMQIFALDDQWVLVPDDVIHPETMFVSADGLEWQEVPKPAGLSAGYVRWLARVGDRVQAVGEDFAAEDVPLSMWTWELGEPVPEGEVLGNAGWIDQPVPFQGGYVATGYGPERSGLAIWRMEAGTEG